MSSVYCDDIIKLYTEPHSKLQIPALRGIELNIRAGSLVAIIGPSGSGKTTLVNVIGGLDRPTAGSVHVGDTRVDQLKGRALNRYLRNQVGFLSQNPHQNLIWNLNVHRNVLLPMRMSHMNLGREERNKRANELLEKVGLLNRSKSRPNTLSGGEAQRAGLAVALANNPDILLADEPTGELDSNTTFKIIDYLRELNKEFNKTMIVVTHDVRFANMTNIAYRILDGRISGLHRATMDIDELEKIDKPLEREELIFVDSHGNLRLPENVRKGVGIKNFAKVVQCDDHARLYPVKEG